MTIDIYVEPGSPPCTVVLLAAKSIGVELNLKSLDFFKQEKLSPEFLKINPQHMVPTIVDNGFVLWESRAIMTYLQNQYGKDDSLYPKDPKKRAVVDQRLYFDMDMYSYSYQIYDRQILGGKPADPEILEAVNKRLGFLDTFLEQSEYVAGDNLTLADLSIVVQISNLELLKHDLSPYKNITRWFAKLKTTVPGYKEYCEDQLEAVKRLIAVKRLVI